MKNSSRNISASARSAAASATSASGRTDWGNDVKRLVLLVTGAVLWGCASTPPSPGLERIQTIVVIYAENRSFDHLYGLFPGADGIADATAEQKTQLDHDGTPLPHLPPVYVAGKPSPAFPERLPNGPFRIDLPPVNRTLRDQLP